MGVTPGTVARKLQAARVVSTVLSGRIVAFPALTTRQVYYYSGISPFSHLYLYGSGLIGLGPAAQPPLFQYFSYHAGAYGMAAFSDSESDAFFQGDGGDEFDCKFGVIAGHYHFDAFG